MPRSTTWPSAVISSIHDSTASRRAGADGREEVGSVQREPGLDRGDRRQAAPRRSRGPPSGRPGPTSARRRPGTSPATPARRAPWRSRPSRRRARAKNRRASASSDRRAHRRRRGRAMQKKPVSRQAASMAAATVEPIRRTEPQGLDVDAGDLGHERSLARRSRVTARAALGGRSPASRRWRRGPGRAAPEARAGGRRGARVGATAPRAIGGGNNGGTSRDGLVATSWRSRPARRRGSARARRPRAGWTTTRRWPRRSPTWTRTSGRSRPP